MSRGSPTPEAPIAAGGVPRRLAFTANGTTAVIANEAGWVDIVR
jgi:hypothetical protein